MKMNYEAVEAQSNKLSGILTTLPGCVIAGGYLRDLLLDKPTRDIDIMIDRLPTSEELDALDVLLGCKLFEHVIDIDENYVPEGGRTSDINVVFETDDESVNVIVVDNVQTHISEFPDNISKVYYDRHFGLMRLSDFIYGHANKVIKYRTTAAMARVSKLTAKFPDYRLEFV
jgi:hypothetical protein